MKALRAKLFLLIVLAGCASQPSVPPSSIPEVALSPCTGSEQAGCVVKFFLNDAAMKRRDRSSVPAHYLELNNPRLLMQDCQDMQSQILVQRAFTKIEDDPGCVERLKRFADFFFPRLQPTDIGLALQGGGNKEAPFAMGFLAGVVEDPWYEDVRAISSVSGGSYAASFFYNRQLDRLKNVADPGTPEDWFRSCILEFYTSQVSVKDRTADAPFSARFLASNPKTQYCLEQTLANAAGSNTDSFDRPYRFQGHVWENHDLVMVDDQQGLAVKEGTLDLGKPISNTLLLFGESMLAEPASIVGRSVFRWPFNPAPTRQAYKNGIVREYGYSPNSWECLHGSGFDCEHSGNPWLYTIADLAALDRIGAPLWYLQSAAETNETPASWISVSATDPLRHTFEMTPTAYGAPFFGYARQIPIAEFQGNGNSRFGVPMPLPDGVTISAAFLDDEQVGKNSQPDRLLANSTQHLLNLAWYAEIPNFNVGREVRSYSSMAPWPFYFRYVGQSDSAYIHLSDGGNVENSGILALLRHGYTQILASLGDTPSTLDDIAQLKNQLELDGTYFVQSPMLEKLAAGRKVRDTPMSYLDQLALRVLTDGDLANHDRNYDSYDPMNGNDVGRLICARYHGEPFNQMPSAECAEYAQFQASDCLFFVIHGCWRDRMPKPWKEYLSMQHQWSGPALPFYVVRQANAGESTVHPSSPLGRLLKLKAGSPSAHLVATVYVVVPSINRTDFFRQLSGNVVQPSSDALRPDVEADLEEGQKWHQLCAALATSPSHLNIKSCVAPDGKTLNEDGSSAENAVLPCNVMGYLLVNSCNRYPTFPDDSMVVQTWHSDYVRYSAYFDLAHAETREALHLIRNGAFLDDLSPTEVYDEN